MVKFDLEDIVLVVKVDGRIIEKILIEPHINHMKYNNWKRCHLMTVGNLEVEFKRRNNTTKRLKSEDKN